MHKKSAWLLFLVGILLFGFVVFALIIDKEPYQKWEIPASQVLVKNKNAAAGTFLKNQGYEVENLEFWYQFKPKKTDMDQLLIIDKQNLKTIDGQKKLLDWVAQGNHAVIPMEDYYADMNPLDFNIEEEDDESFAPESLTESLGVDYENSEADDSHDHFTASTEQTNKEDTEESEILKLLKMRNIAGTAALGNYVEIANCVQSSKARIAAKDQEWFGKPDNAKKTANQAPNVTNGSITSILESIINTSEDGLVAACSKNITQIKFVNDKVIYILFRDSYSNLDSQLEYTGKEKVLFTGKNQSGVQTIRFAHKAGTITIVPNDSSFLDNPRLPTVDYNSFRQFDHAYFLAYLSQGKSKVIFLPKAVDHTRQQPKLNLFKMLYKNAPEVLVALILFTILFAWSQLYRQGPLLAKIDTARRNLRDHFHAQGEFLRRHVDRRVLIQMLQEDIWHKIQKRISNIKELPLDDQKRELARLTHLKESEFSALLIPVKEKISTFETVEFIIALQKIRNSL